jgi:hypothetical protein
MSDQTAPGDAPATDALSEEEALWNELNAPDAEPAEAAPAAAEAPVAAETATEAAPAETETTADAEAPPEGAASADPWEAVPEVLRSEYRSLRHQADSDRGRIAAFQRQIAELQAKVEAAAAPKAPAAGATAADGDVDAHLARVREEYPEIGEPIVAVIDQLRRQNAELVGWQQQQIARHYDTQARMLGAAHPDWTQLFKDRAADLAAWLEGAPEEIRAAAQRNGERIEDAGEAASVVAAFKAHLQAKQAPAASPVASAPAQAPRDARRERQILGATAVAPSGRQASSARLPDDADEEAIWNAEVAAAFKRRTG